MQPQAEAKADKSQDIIMVVEEPKPIFRGTDACEQVTVKTIEFVSVNTCINTTYTSLYITYHKVARKLQKK